MITIVYSHPGDASFNHSILKAVTDTLTAEGREYRVIDLYADGFNPVMSRKDLELYPKGETDDPLVKRYAQELLDTDRIIFIFPIWWGMMPAMVKGFFDRVLLKGAAYDMTDTGDLMPNLSINRTLIVTTSDAPSVEFGTFFQGYLVPMVLESVGMNNAEWYNCDSTDTASDEKRKEFIQLIIKGIS